MQLYRIAVDPLFPPPLSMLLTKKVSYEILYENKFELIFDEQIDSKLVDMETNIVPICTFVISYSSYRHCRLSSIINNNV